MMETCLPTNQEARTVANQPVNVEIGEKRKSESIEELEELECPAPKKRKGLTLNNKTNEFNSRNFDPQ